MSYQARAAEQLLRQYLKAFVVVAITGPRQSGKSTLLQHCLPDYTYISFDDPQVREQFYRDPAYFISSKSDAVIFDEVQKVPEIFEYIKLAVDNDRARYGKFVITGSSQLLMQQKISESLAGRLGMLTLLPFQFTEIKPALSQQAIYQGSYPELVGREYAFSNDWYANYVHTYLERDVRSLSNIGDLRDFTRLLYALAANTSQLLNYSNYASDLGVSVTTIKRWISLLEASYIIYILPPFYSNLGKRVIKSSKVYFYDTGLAAFLTNSGSYEHYQNGPMTGALFENYVVMEVYKQLCHSNNKSKLYFYRSSHGAEVDLIIDHMRCKTLIEIKHSNTFKALMFKNIEKIITEQDQGLVLYQGQNISDFAQQLAVFNYQDYLREFTKLTVD